MAAAAHAAKAQIAKIAAGDVKNLARNIDDGPKLGGLQAAADYFFRRETMRAEGRIEQEGGRVWQARINRIEYAARLARLTLVRPVEHCGIERPGKYNLNNARARRRKAQHGGAEKRRDKFYGFHNARPPRQGAMMPLHV